MGRDISPDIGDAENTLLTCTWSYPKSYTTAKISYMKTEILFTVHISVKKDISCSIWYHTHYWYNKRVLSETIYQFLSTMHILWENSDKIFLVKNNFFGYFCILSIYQTYTKSCAELKCKTINLIIFDILNYIEITKVKIL